MSCYHPMFGVFKNEFHDSGGKKFQLVACPPDPIQAKMLYPGSVMIPCGKCIGCRLDYSRQWADRMTLELVSAGKGIFVTLTYDDDHINVATDPDTGEAVAYTLRKKDLSDFIKVLRSRKKFEDRRISFFASGEYGPKTLRPHMHAIIFGVGLDDFSDLTLKGKNNLGQSYYISEEFSTIWNKGFSLICDVSWQTCAYVSRYVQKKIGKDLLDLSPEMEPEFSLMSRRPGLGRRYLDENPDCLDYVSISIGSDIEGRKIQIPKYFYNQLKLTDKYRFDILKEQRVKFAEDKMLLKLQKTDLSYIDLLGVEERSLLNRINVLKRDKV